MSTALKWIVALVVIVGAGALVWWSGWLKPAPGGMQAAVVTSTATTTQATSTLQQQNGMSAPNDSSDAALVQDTTAVDAQMQGLSTDDTQVSSSLNDKPVTQSY